VTVQTGLRSSTELLLLQRKKFDFLESELCFALGRDASIVRVRVLDILAHSGMRQLHALL